MTKLKIGFYGWTLPHLHRGEAEFSRRGRSREVPVGLPLANVADLGNPIEMSLCADKKRPVSNCIGSEGALVEGIARELLKRFARRKHHTDTLLVLQINSSIRQQRRCRVIPTHTLRPVHSASHGIDTACDA